LLKLIVVACHICI